jgi:hypothetical protein
MINIDKAKQFLDFIIRKHNSAWLDPEQFNLVINRASQTKFMELYGNPKEYTQKPLPRVAYELTQKISDDLKPFKAETNIILSSNGQGLYPNDYQHCISIGYTAQQNGNAIKVPIDIVSQDKELYRLSSAIVPPTKTRPIAILKNNYIQIHPLGISNITFQYLKKPAEAKWGYTLVNNRPVYDPATSVDLEWDEICLNDIIMRAASYIGISIKDRDIMQYAELKRNTGT